jgi:peptide/nickel transport system substrate-binding protein
LRRLFSLVAVVGLVLSACSKSSTTAAPSPPDTNGTLNLAYLADMSVPDPDVFYDIEGNTVILSAYQGLVDYKPDTTTIEPLLATSWDISTDGLTYTFHLRSGVTFQDGTPFNAAAVKTSFQRRTSVNSAPAYMLAQVADMQTPDPMTFVVKLKSVVTPFMDYMASSWGPKIISPKALTDNAGNDFAQTWAKTNADGTGPFKLTQFNRGRNYTLTRNDSYWGSKPNFATVNIRIIPDMNSQILQLKSGGLDVILHSFPVAELPTAKADANLTVKDFSSYLQSLLYFNTSKAPFSALPLRKAVAADIDRDTIVSQIYQSYGHPAGSPYAPGILDQSLAPISYPTATVKAPAGTPAITFAYTSDESGIQSRLAGLIQQKLQGQGFQVTLKEVTNSQVYDYATSPQKLAAAPDMLLMTNTPDAAHPDTWARILWGTNGGLNFLGYSNPQVDTLLNQGASSTNKTASDQAYAEAGKLLVADYGILFVADTRDVMVMRKNLTSIQHVPNYPWALRLGDLARS